VVTGVSDEDDLWSSRGLCVSNFETFGIFTALSLALRLVSKGCENGNICLDGNEVGNSLDMWGIGFEQWIPLILLVPRPNRNPSWNGDWKLDNVWETFISGNDLF
jgi:hypothetical protein